MVYIAIKQDFGTQNLVFGVIGCEIDFDFSPKIYFDVYIRIITFP